MENFDANRERIKEKNIYSLHLDTPRIIIVSSVIIGLIIISFLIGMNYVKSGSDKNMISGEVLLNEDKEKGKIDFSKDFSIENEKQIDLSEEKIPELKNDEIQKDSLTDNSKSNISEKKSNDVLAENKIDLIVPSKKVKEKKVVKKIVKAKKIEKRKASKRKKIAKKRVNKSRVREVSYSNRSAKKDFSRRYSVQVASYDSLRKAKAEIKKLNSKSYSSYYIKKRVNGKEYYRVRVGPRGSKKEAIRLLNKIQDMTRYSESYMVRE